MMQTRDFTAESAMTPIEARRATWRTRLSARELEIALLVGRGWTTATVAATLMISPRTVEKHVSAIFAKLAFRSRTELAIFITERRELT